MGKYRCLECGRYVKETELPKRYIMEGEGTIYEYECSRCGYLAPEEVIEDSYLRKFK